MFRFWPLSGYYFGMSKRAKLILVSGLVVAMVAVWIVAVRPVVEVEVNDGVPWLFVKDGHNNPIFDSAKVLE